MTEWESRVPGPQQGQVSPRVDMLERLNQEIRRREKIIRIFPSKDSAWRLVGALPAEKHEEWSTSRRYLKTDEFYDWLNE